jgi:hypothetical protein
VGAKRYIKSDKENMKKKINLKNKIKCEIITILLELVIKRNSKNTFL